MSRLHVEAEGTVTAPPAVVWALLADASSYCRWGPWTTSGYQSPGDPVSGVGAGRWMQLGRTTVVEKVLAAEAGQRLAYTVLKGIPVRDYQAEVTLTPAGTGTHIRWVADWDRTLPGRVVHRKLRAVFPEVVSRLIAAADSEVRAT